MKFSLELPFSKSNGFWGQQASYWSILVITSILLIGGSSSLKAQDRVLNSAIKYYEEGSYQRAIPLYQKVLKREFNFEAMRCLAESYRQVRDFEKASKWYGYVVNTEYAGADDFLHYGLVLMRQRRYEQARDQFLKFSALNPQDERGARYLEAARQHDQGMKRDLNYSVQKLPFNSSMSDFCAVPFRDGLLFTSGRIKDRVVKRSTDRDGTSFLDLYFVAPKDSASWGKPKLIKGGFNTKFHEAAAVYDETEQIFFFTRNNFLGGKMKSSRDGLVKLKIFYAGLEEGGDWTNMQTLPFNSDEYSVGHPSLAGGGKDLYFASDMPGGYGGTDIWKSTLSDTGWVVPVNLGPLVNTVGDEMFPAIQQDGNLFFSSEGHGGEGGLDLFMAHATPTGWGDVRRLPAPINSSGDDFGYTLNPDGVSGYFSSDRNGGDGMDDIYAFSIQNPTLAGQVMVAETGAALSGATVTLTEVESGEIVRMTTQEEGRFGAILQPGRDYLVRISRDGFLDQVLNIDTKEKKKSLRQSKTIYLGQPQLVVDGVARDQKTGYALSGVEVVLAPGDRSTWSAMGGVFHFDLEPGGEYTLEARRPGYHPATIKVDADVKMNTHRIPVEVELAPDVGQLALQGQVLDIGGNPIEGVDLFLINRKERDEVTAVSGPNGTYSFSITPKDKYQLVARFTGYQTTEESFEAPALRKGIFPKNIRLRTVGAGRPTAFKSIYYDYGESILRQESLGELDRLAKMLNRNKERRIVISSSTDSRGSADYNLSLSGRRAEAVARYLISKGIDKGRVEAIGYGETRLVNQCENGVSCSEEQHQANRRTEFTLLPARKTSVLISKKRSSVASRPTRDGHYPPLDVGEPACYRVQIGVFDTPNKADIPIRLGEEIAASLNVVPVDTALFRYQLGECEIYANAKSMYAKAIDAGFEGAFIAVYQNGKRVSIPGRMEKPELSE